MFVPKFCSSPAKAKFMKLSISNLSKTYPNGVNALNDVSFEIESGMFGLLGPNGAGKSSLMRTIATLQEPDSGSIMLGDLDVLKDKMEVRKVLGYLPQDFGFYPKINAEDMLNHFAILKGVADSRERKEIVAALLEQTNLYNDRKKKLGTYSGGMKQRFGIAQALLGNPKLIIVDEPTAGLDPNERNRFHNLLSEIGENIIVILSTHIVDDVKNLCKNMVIMNKGEIIARNSPRKAVEEITGKIWRKLIDKEQLDQARQEYNVISSMVTEGRILIHTFADAQPAGCEKVENPSLDDVYFTAIKMNGIPSNSNTVSHV